MPITVLALVPHPDDAEFYAGGTLAQMSGAGHKVIVAVATDGRCGSFEHDAESLVALRAAEQVRAAAALGAEPPICLGYGDFGLERLAPGVLRERFIRLIRQLRPAVLITEDPYAPDEPHPDHRAVAWAALEAVNYASLPLIHPEHAAAGLAPHFVAEKYFYSNSNIGADKVVDISETLPVKLAALAEHRSQMVFLAEGILRQARLAGLDTAAVMAQFGGDPAAALAWALTAQAAAVGRTAGFRHGEAFRYVRYDPLVESLQRGR